MSIKRSNSVRSQIKSLTKISKPEPLSEIQNDSLLNCTISDCTCPICLDILIEPVTMPCTHELCLPCFKSMTDLTNFLCPMCRQRISTWYRASANSNTLVNQERWTFIQKKFPIEVKNRLEGKTAQIIADQIEKQKKGIYVPVNSEDKSHKICSEPGEIRKEYQEYLKREEERLRIEKENEEKKSLELIQKLIQEEERLSMNDYLSLINNTPVVPATSSSQPLRQLSNTNNLNRQINNLNNQLIDRMSNRNNIETPIRIVPTTSNQPIVENDQADRRNKRKYSNSIESNETPRELVTRVHITRSQSRYKTARPILSHNNLNDSNESVNSVIIVDENNENNAGLVRRHSLRPRAAKQAKH